MDLNTFGAETVKQLTRIANALEAKNTSAAASTASASDSQADKPKKPVRRTAAQKAADEKAAAAAKPKHTRDEMNAALITLKDECGKEHAQEVIREVGQSARMADIKDELIDAVFEAAKAKAEELASDDNGGDDI